MQHLLLQPRKAVPRLAAPQQQLLRNRCPSSEGSGSSITNTLKVQPVVAVGMPPGLSGTRAARLALLNQQLRPSADSEEEWSASFELRTYADGFELRWPLRSPPLPSQTFLQREKPQILRCHFSPPTGGPAT